MFSLTMAEKAAEFDRLFSRGVINETHLLPDLTRALERVLEANLLQLSEPVFRNPTTGKVASAVSVVLPALGFDYTKRWTLLVHHFVAHGGGAVFMRRDLPKANPRFPTICVDLDAIEGLLLSLQPRKAKKVITAFKERHGCA